MQIDISQLNPKACKSYLLKKAGSHQVILIDPVLDEVENYLKYFKENQFTLTHVIDTHTHADHISGSPALKDLTACAYVMHEKTSSQCVTHKLTDKFKGELSGVPIEVIYTPGHTQDSMCLRVENALFTGDTLFLDEGGGGRDDLQGGDSKAHWESLQKLIKLPDQLMVYPAHDYRNRSPSTLGEQKKNNPHFQHPSQDEFVKYLEDLKLGPADWMKDVLKANYACARDPKAAWIPVDSPACEIKGTLDLGVNDIQVNAIGILDFRAKLQGEEKPLLLDVRRAEELQGPLGHLPEAVNIPIDEISHRLSELSPYKSKEIVAVCRSGGRAFTAAQILTAEGFNKVLVLDGGMQAFRDLSP